MPKQRVNNQSDAGIHYVPNKQTAIHTRDTYLYLMSEEVIPADELDDALKRCPEWEAEGDAITRTIEFEEYMEGIDFVNVLAEIVSEAQHFPEIDIRESGVTLRLKTEQAGGVTELDVELASRIDNLVD